MLSREKSSSSINYSLGYLKLRTLKRELLPLRSRKTDKRGLLIMEQIRTTIKRFHWSRR